MRQSNPYRRPNEEAQPPLTSEESEAEANYDLAVKGLGSLSGKLQAVANSSRDDLTVRYAERARSSRHVTLRLHAAPIDPAQDLTRHLFDEEGRTVICTSATLATEGSFEHFKARCGVAGLPLELIADPVFDYSKQALLYQPALPAFDWRNKAPFYDAVAAEIERLLNVSRGRALCLFTSWTGLQQVHERLNDVGMCILLGHYSYNPEQTTPDKYCDNPLGQAKAAPTIVPELTLPLMTLEPSTPGIIYRPRKAYLVNLFGKRDPKGLEPWLMIQSQQVAFENLSPVFSIGIDRALFAERRTAMIFDDGALKTVCTTKGSEILGFIEVPLEVVRSVVALPSQILKVDMDEVRNRTKLNQAQAEVLKLQDEILRRELGLTEELPAKNKGASGEAEQQGLSTFVQSDSENEDVIAAPTIKQANSLLNELCGTNSKVEGI